MITRIIFCVLSAVGLLTAEAHAQLFLENGKVVLSIQNTSNEPADVKVYWEDFQYKSPYDGTKDFLPAGTAPSSASQWVTFTPQEFTLPAFGKQRIDYTIAVPSTIQEGHYGVLFFEKSSTLLKNGEGVSLVTRVGCLFFIEPKDKVKKAVLQDIAIKTDSITANFVNQGNVILIPHTTYYLMQNGGLVLLRGDNKNAYVPPGATASIEVPLKKKLSQGQYTMVVNADLDDGDVVVKEIGLSVDASGQVSIANSQD